MHFHSTVLKKSNPANSFSYIYILYFIFPYTCVFRLKAFELGISGLSEISINRAFTTRYYEVYTPH